MKNKPNTIFKKIRLLSMVFSLLLLSGCVSWVFTPGMSELEELCEKDGGMQVYETVEVEGYFSSNLKGCWGCWDKITLNGFKFLELEVLEGKGLDIFNHDAGYWRLEKVDRSSGQCHAGIERMLMRQKNSSGMKKFIKNYCIAAEKTDKPKSDYAVGGSKNEWVVNGYYKSTITQLETRIWNINTDKTIGTWISYLLNPWPKSALDYGVVYDCVDIGAVEREEPLIRQVLKLKTK